MKNKTLKHYKRKKFFYRFFMRKSPRSGAMFGLAWMICFGAILPLSLWIFAKITPDWASDSIFNVIFWAVVALLFFTVCLLIYAYGFLTFAKNFYTILRNDLKKSRFWKITAIVGAFSWELAGMFLLLVILHKRRWLSLLFLLGSLGCNIASYMIDIPLQKWYCLHVGVAILLLLAVAVSGKEKFFSWKFTYPLALFLFFVMHLYWLDFLCNAQIFAKKLELGTAISAEDWKIRNSCGYSINKEPVKSFCKVDMKIDMEKYQTPEDAKKYLAELRKTEIDKFIAIDKLLELKPQRISYNWVEPGVPVAGMLLPDLQCFRTAANLRILEMRANAADKTVIAKCNQDLLQFREWCLHNETLIGKLVAGAVDNRRLYALSYAMASGVYSKEEIIKLIGDAPDWSKQYSETFASENAMSEEFVNRLENASAEAIQSLEIPSSTKTFWKFYQKFAPLFVKMNIKRDYLFTLDYYLKINSLLYRDDLSGLEKKKMAYLNYDSLWAEHFIASQVVIPALSEVLVRIDRTRDVRQMTLLAAEVMEYRKQHGKLPEDLSFLPQIPLSKLDHKPLMYEKTREGFRIFSHTDKGEKPDEKDTRFSYRVRLVENAGLSIGQLTAIAEKKLVKVYGKQVLKQRPWKITRNDEKSITLTGTFYGPGKGGVAEITLQKSDGKVLRMIHGK